MKTKRNLWPVGILLLGISFTGITGWSIYRASSGASSVTDPRYYSHGLKYNRTSVETTAAETMGWSLNPILTNQTISLTLTDKKGAAISGCKGSISFSKSPTTTDHLATVELNDIGNGIYSAQLPAGITNNTSASITLTKDQATIRRNLLINL